MSFFNLPARTKVNRVVPKNTFDDYINTKQKKQFTDLIQRITWTHKLSSETINLESKEIIELQVFKIELKDQENIPKLIEIINKAIPYHIVSWIEFNDKAYISTAAKHMHPIKENVSIIDWTFTSEWFNVFEAPYHFNLKSSIDSVFKDICVQIMGNLEYSQMPINSILELQIQISGLTKEVEKLKRAISNSSQFNKKVELNQQLASISSQLNSLLNANS